MRRARWGVAAGVLLVGIAVPFGHHHAKPPDPATYPTSTATVARRELASQTRVDATLGYAGTYTVVNQAQGTITALPRIGQVVRQGQVLYRVSGRPVVLLYGTVPAYRSLSYGMKGRDVAELNAALGHSGDRFGTTTMYALMRLQRRLGVDRTGELALGDAVFLPGAARVTGHASAVLGGPVRPGMTLMSATSTAPVVTIDLDAVQQTEVRAGNTVTVTLPDGRTTPGRVASVSHVAKAARTAGESPTIAVRVTLAHPKAAGGLDQAPVQVSIVTGSVRDALVVPVSALLAQTGGGYAVEVADPKGNHLVRVSPGLFDDAEGLVQVTSSGLSPGQRVVVPTA
jgi:multidrug efflux pump subunit AcrA (membrane-fusion protein)